jgi:hypothetical protein
MKLALPSKYVDVLLIPERTIQYVRPLDIILFWNYKILIRWIEGNVRVSLLDSGIKFHDCSFIMKMHSVVYNQFGAPAYTNLLLYAWKKPSFVTHKTFVAFVITNTVLFNFRLETCR